MCRNRLVTKVGVNYSVMNERQVFENGAEKTVDMRVVHRKEDNVVFMETRVVEHREKRAFHWYATVPLEDGDIKFLAAAFVEINLDKLEKAA
jgi:hypothetical protein